MGIYYDDPGNLQNPSDFRACLGLLVNKNEGGASQLIKYFEDLGYLKTELPRVNTVHGGFPMKMRALSYPIAAMKFYPTCLAYLGQNKEKYENLFKNNAEGNGGSIEVTIGDTIHYHWPMEQREKFNLTRHPRPQWKDESKYTDLMDKGAKKTL